MGLAAFVKNNLDIFFSPCKGDVYFGILIDFD